MEKHKRLFIAMANATHRSINDSLEKAQQALNEERFSECETELKFLGILHTSIERTIAKIQH